MWTIPYTFRPEMQVVGDGEYIWCYQVETKLSNDFKIVLLSSIGVLLQLFVKKKKCSSLYNTKNKSIIPLVIQSDFEKMLKIIFFTWIHTAVKRLFPTLIFHCYGCTTVYWSLMNLWEKHFINSRRFPYLHLIKFVSNSIRIYEDDDQLSDKGNVLLISMSKY